MKRFPRLYSKTILFLVPLVLQLPARAQSVFNGTFEDSNANFSLSGWAWDCEDPEPGPAYQSYWGVQKLTAVTGLPPDPCSGVTVMQHPLPDTPNALYSIQGWAYVDDPAISASIGFAYTDGFGGLYHEGDYTSSTTWDWLLWENVPTAYFQGFAPQASLATSDGLNGYGYAHYDQLEVTVNPLSTGLPIPSAAGLRLSLSPDGDRLALLLPDPKATAIHLYDPLGRLELALNTVGEGPARPVVVGVAALPRGVHLVIVEDADKRLAGRFVKP